MSWSRFRLALLSDDPPRSVILSLLLAVIAVSILLTPFVFPGSQPIGAAAKICIFIMLAASYDILLGYTGVVSFAHTMFFGIGGYGVAISLDRLGPGWGQVAIGMIAALILACTFAMLIGLLSLRVRAIFFAMITLAFASAFLVLASQLSGVTGGEDGISFQLPAELRPSYRPFGGPVFGVVITGRILTFYMIAATTLLVFLGLLRIVNSPFGRVLQAIRENEFRAEALGYRVVAYRTAASVLSAAAATIAGAMLALWLRYNGPDTSLSFSIMIDVLLMVVIGGMGTLYGAVFGATLLILAQTYLQGLMAKASAAVADVPLLTDILHPDRWLLWLGVLFVLSVYFFPSGIVGRLRKAHTA